MNDIQNKVLWAVGAVVASLFLVAVFHVGSIASVVKSLGSSGAGITNLTGLSIDGSSPGTLTVNGAATMAANCNSAGGITTCDYTATMVSSTTPCAFALGTTATTTLVFAAARVSSSSASTAFVEFGKSATLYSTTTTLGTGSLSANAQGTVLASTSQSTGFDGSAVFGPTSPDLVLKTTLTQLGGTCQAETITIN